MAITKGIVSKGNYTFSAANKTITFSSDYLGMSLSDITYITNITSGVATIIYDPFNAAKGGVLNGLTLTLAYNTVAMSDNDSLQIIVGFTPSTSTPQNVDIAPNLQLDAQNELLEGIADNIDMLAKAQDWNERMPIYIRDDNPALRDINNAQVVSDGIEIRSRYINRLNDFFMVDTTGYNTAVFTITGDANANIVVTPEISMDGSRGQVVQNITYNSGSAPTNNFAGTGISMTANLTTYVVVYSIFKFTRIRITTASAGGITVSCLLKNTVYGAGTNTGPNANVLINNVVPTGLATPNTSATAPQGVPTNIPITGGLIATSNPPNAASVVSSTVPYPIGIAGREQPYMGNLSGLLRYLMVDGGGRQILGGDSPDTETKNQSRLASGALPGIPPRGVSARSNNMFGGQSLHVENTSQAEGDTIPLLLQQILVELKLLNQQINEIPFAMNQGIKMQNEVAEYRQEEYNNHVNNQ